MAKVKLNFGRLSAPEKVARARVIVEKMTLNAADFPNPIPALADVIAIITATEKALGNALDARALAKQRTAELEAQEDELDKAVRRLTSFVDSASGGDENIILKAGMDVREQARPTGEPPPVPTGLTATVGDHEGEIDLSWNFHPHAQSYIVQVSPNPPTDSSWTQAAVVTISKHTVNGLQSGTKVWFRVAAVGAGGQSGWSDPAVKMVP